MRPPEELPTAIKIAYREALAGNHFTAGLQYMSKRDKRPVNALHATLMDLFPQAFPKDYAALRPLKHGIAADVLSRLVAQGTQVDPDLLRRVLANHTHRDGYLLALLHGRGDRRYDLDGQPAGTVTEAERAEAARRLEISRQRQQAQAERWRVQQARDEARRRQRAEEQRHREEKARRQAEHERRRQEAAARPPVSRNMSPEPPPTRADAPPAKPQPSVQYKKRRTIPTDARPGPHDEGKKGPG